MDQQTTQGIADNIVSQLEAALEESFPDRAFSRVVAKAFAGVWILIYKYAGFMLLQMFPAHASARETVVNGKRIRPLYEWGRLLGVGDPKPATRAELKIKVTVQTLTGELPAGAQLVRSATGVIYNVVASVPLTSPFVYPTIRAASDPSGGGGLGTVGNLEPGDVVEFVNTRNVATQATVESSAATGADAESVAQYRARVVRRMQRRPQGGAYADYQAWAEEVPGILNAYPYTGGPNEIEIYVEAAPLIATDKGYPTEAQKAAVKASVEKTVDGKASRRPANVNVEVKSITRRHFGVDITGLEPNSLTIREAITAGLSEYLRSREPFIDGLSTLPRTDKITAAALTGVAESIASAHGASITSLSMTPGPTHTLAKGEKAWLAYLSA